MFKSCDNLGNSFASKKLKLLSPLLERPAQATLARRLNNYFPLLTPHTVDHLLSPSLLSDERPASFLLSLVSLPSTLPLPQSLFSWVNMSIEVCSRHWLRHWVGRYNTGDIREDSKNSPGDNRMFKEGLLMTWGTAFVSPLMFSLYWQEAHLPFPGDSPGA